MRAAAFVAALGAIMSASSALGAVGERRLPSEDRLEEVIYANVNRALKKLNLKVERGNVVVDAQDPNDPPGGDDSSISIELAEKSCVNIEAVALILRAAADAFATPHGVGHMKQLRLSVFAPNDVVDQRNVPIDELLKLRKANPPTAHYLAVGERDDPLRQHDTRFYAGCTQKLCAPEPETKCTARQEPPRR